MNRITSYPYRAENCVVLPAPLQSYSYDVVNDQVFSFKSGSAQQLTWQNTVSHRNMWRVTFYTRVGGRMSLNRKQLLEMVERVRSDAAKSKPVAPTKTVATKEAVVTKVQDVKLDYPFVLFSKTNQCSQYFWPGTTVQEALDRLARRGEVVKPQDVRILNVNTNQVHSLRSKMVETFTLV